MTPEARSFVTKWLAQEPEMEPALGFLAAAQRELAACWGALQNELFDAMTEPRDSGVAQVKLAWWGETLSRGAGQGAAHPLVRALFAHDAAVRVPPSAWHALVNAALRLGAEQAAPGDLAAAIEVRLTYSTALAQVEAQLFDAGASHAPFMASDDSRTDASTLRSAVDDAHGRAIAISFLTRQLRATVRGSRARHPFLPLQLFARHNVRAAEFDASKPDAASISLLRDYATALDDALPKNTSPVASRRMRTALDRHLLKSIRTQPDARAATLSRWTALWTAWRAARRG